MKSKFRGPQLCFLNWVSAINFSFCLLMAFYEAKPFAVITLFLDFVSLLEQELS